MNPVNTKDLINSMDYDGIAELMYDHQLIEDWTPCGWVKIDNHWETLREVYPEIRHRYLCGLVSVNLLLAVIFDEIENV